MLTHAQDTWLRELIATGAHTIEAMHRLTGVSRKAISEIRAAVLAGDLHFRSCASWRCPTCGGTLHVTPCVWCDGEQQDHTERRRLARFVDRIVGRRIVQPRHPSFTSYG